MIFGSMAEEHEDARFGPFRLNVAARLLLKNDEPVTLGSRAFDILVALVGRAGEVVSRRELMKRVWPDVVVEEANLRVHIADLRKTLGSGSDATRYIANVPGRGYSFVAPVLRSTRPAPVIPAARNPSAGQGFPERPQRMVGRQATVRELCTQIATERFVSIVGPAGMGKTTVAIAVAHELGMEFAGAIHFVDLDALDDGSLVLSAVASALGWAVPAQDPLAGLVARLAESRLLLILDNCEHVVAVAAALAERLVREAPAVHILATSREAIRAEGENVFLLQPLDSPADSIALNASDVLSSAAVQLFMERATAGGYRQPLMDDEAPIVARICRQLDGIPLAIELAASRVGTYGIPGLARLIDDRMTLLWQGRRSMPRHRTLRSALDWSYKLLSQYEADVLCQLSVFIGSFRMQAVHAVIEAPEGDVWRVADVITGLVDKSLISVSQLGGESAYRLLNTTRTYAAARLVERGEENAVARRHALYYFQRLAEVQANPDHTFDPATWSRQIGDITAALEWSLSRSGEIAIAVPLSVGAVTLFLRLSMLKECCYWCRRTLRVLPEENRGTKLELILQQSLAIASMYAYGNSNEVRDALERGLGLAEALDDRDHKLHLLAGLNLFLTRCGDFGAALSAAERYASVTQQGGRSHEIVIADWMLAASHHLVGDQAAAQRYYEIGFRRADAGLPESRYFGYDHRVRALIGCARTMWIRGFSDQAVRMSHQGIELANSLAHPVTFCICMVYVVPIFMWVGDRAAAGHHIEQLGRCASKHLLAPYFASSGGLRGEFDAASGEVAQGIVALRNATATLRTEQHWILASMLARPLSEYLVKQGQVEEAKQIVDDLIAKAEGGAGTFDFPELLRVRAEVLLASSPSNWSAAEASLERALESARKQSALVWELRSAMALARLWANRQRPEAAMQLLVDVLARFTEGFGTPELIEASRMSLELKARIEQSAAGHDER